VNVATGNWRPVSSTHALQPAVPGAIADELVGVRRAIAMMAVALGSCCQLVEIGFSSTLLDERLNFWPGNSIMAFEISWLFADSQWTMIRQMWTLEPLSEERVRPELLPEKVFYVLCRVKALQTRPGDVFVDNPSRF